jgi:hypothetical protein
MISSMARDCARFALASGHPFLLLLPAFSARSAQI